MLGLLAIAWLVILRLIASAAVVRYFCEPHQGWQFGVQALAQSDCYTDELNEQGKYGGFVQLDASLRYNLSPVSRRCYLPRLGVRPACR